jgi:hypothetical protein
MTVTKTTTAASAAMSWRTSSSGPENSPATCEMPAFWTLISCVEHITISRVTAAIASAIRCSARWLETRRRTVGQRAQCALMPGDKAGTV